MVATQNPLTQDDTEKRKKDTPSNNLEKICRSEAEAGLGFLMHFLLLLFYTVVHAYDAHLYWTCENPDKYFVGWKHVGGQLRYLTNITLVSV